MSTFHVVVGGWYPRTTLHLTEVYELLHNGTSDLPLNKKVLSQLHEGLKLSFVTRETEYFEYIHAHTTNEVDIKYFEDGLFTIETEGKSIENCVKRVEDYMNNSFNPALSYIFSLGAPTPKILAHFPGHHPVVVQMNEDAWQHFKFDIHTYGQVYSQITSHGITVYKTPTHIFIVNSRATQSALKELVQTQIFFREFKDQLKRYLNIHRTIWEEISSIKEKKSVSAEEVSILRSKLDGYQKTISLITNRINQMSAYIITRSKIARAAKVESHLNTLFQYKFEALEDTHTYIKEIWKMTGDYVTSAIAIFVEIQSQSTQRSIQSLQLITLSNVIATLLTKMAVDSVPGVTGKGVFYVLAIIFAAWIVNTLVIYVFRRVKYALKFPEHASLT